MANEQLLNYVRAQYTAGFPQESVQQQLIAQGWNAVEVAEVMTSVYPRTASAVEPVVVSATFSQKESSRRKIFIIGVSVVLCLALIGGGAYAYFGIWRSPERIIGKMLSRMSQAKVYTYAAELKIAFDAGIDLETIFGGEEKVGENELQQVKDSAFVVNGFVNKQDESNPQGQFAMTVQSDVFESQELPALEVRAFGTAIYAKLINGSFVTSLLSLVLGGDIDGKWVLIDPQDIAQRLGLEKVISSVQVIENESSSDDQLKKAKKILAESRFISTVETLASDNIDSVSTHHYKISVDVEAGKKMVDELVASLGEGAFTEKQVTRYKKAFDNFEDTTIEVWIGKKDYLLRRVVLHSSIDATDGINGLITTIDFSQYDNPRYVEVPAGALSIVELVQQSEKAREEKMALRNVDDDGDGLANYKEDTYKTDKNNPDTDGDGYLDGDEVKNGYNPLGEGKMPEKSSQASTSVVGETFDLSRLSHIRGTGAYTLVEFANPDSPYNYRFHETVQSVIETYAGRVRWGYKHISLKNAGPAAEKAMHAFECAADQGKFWEYADEWYVEVPSTAEELNVFVIADKLLLDREQFDACMSSEKHAEIIARDTADATTYKSTGSPSSLLVDSAGKIVDSIPGALPLAQLEKRIEKIIAE